MCSLPSHTLLPLVSEKSSLCAYWMLVAVPLQDLLENVPQTDAAIAKYLDKPHRQGSGQTS